MKLRLALALVCLVPAPALAATKDAAVPIEERDVVSGKVKLDPARGYIFLHGPTRLFGLFLRVPDQATVDEYQQDWEKAFAKAKKRYAGQLASWENAVKLAKQVPKEPPPRPDEPTRETFTIEAIELRDPAPFGPMFVFNKGNDTFSYLTSVKPGTYIYYGPVMVAPGGGVAGTCDCLGSVKFEVRAGVVTNLGTYLLSAPQPAHDHDVMTREAWTRIEEKAARTGKPADPGILAQPPLDYTMPTSLSAWPAVQPEFFASGKLNNFYGILISRLPPIPGVLAYRRDTVIDARTGEELVSRPILSQAKTKK
jgi:hypothetical protein